ncbi:MAG: hypothetical protein K1X94_35755, partial [Sandaracinaceae bacterium]|nr:hypothetical protein [Sandaracinaceae bacterium]
MPNDPHSRRTQPAPPHPSGFSALDDAPVFVAPAVDVRPNSPVRTSLPPPEPVTLPNPAYDAITLPQPDVHFTLPFPVEERKSSMPPPDDADDQPISSAPETVDWERAAKKLAGVPVGASYPAASVPSPASDPRLDPIADHAEIEALTRDLGVITTLDERADRAIDRAVAHRTTLARARALR